MFAQPFIRSLIVSVAFSTIGLTTSSRAALIYNINFGQSIYTIVPGGTVDVSIYLTETATAGETPLLADGGNNGLVLLGSKFTFLGSDLKVGSQDTYNFPADDLLPPFGTSINSVFTTQNVFVDNLTREVDISGLIVSGTAEVPVVPGATSYSILLGTVRFTASPTFTGSVPLTFLPNPFDVNFFPLNTNPATYTDSTITAVPEPGTMALLAVASLGGVTLRSRSRRQSPIGQV